MTRGGGGFAERYYTSQDGLRLFYRDYGPRNAPRLPVLCLPGLTRNSGDFRELAARLAATRRVICPDYRGRGRSAYDPDWRRYRADVYAGDLRHLLAAENLHRVVVVGTSLGGLLAMQLATIVPGALAGVVLNDIGPEVASEGLARIAGYVREVPPQPDWETAAARLAEHFPDMGGRDGAGWMQVARNTYREGADGRLHPDWDPRIAKALPAEGGRTDNLWPMFRALRHVPALALRGEISDILTPETFARMKAEKPDLEQVTVPGIGHAPTLSEPEAAAAIDSFLARVDARG